MGRYRKKPLEVNAIPVQDVVDAFNRAFAKVDENKGVAERMESGEEIGLPEWLLPALKPDPETDEGYGGLVLVGAAEWGVTIRTVQGQDVDADPREWILQAADNPRDIWPIDGEVFANGYEEVVDAEVVEPDDEAGPSTAETVL